MIYQSRTLYEPPSERPKPIFPFPNVSKLEEGDINQTKKIVNLENKLDALIFVYLLRK
jgi:hypothetical protein